MLSVLDLTIIGTYVAIVLGVGIYHSKEGSEDMDSYFLGGNRIPWWVLGISGMISNFDVTGTMVITSFFFIVGLKGYLVAIRGGLTIILPFLLIFMGKWLRRSNVMTTAEWMIFRFGKGAAGVSARILSSVAILLLTITAVGYLAVGMGKFLSLFLGIQPWICSLMVVTVGTLYCLFSGLLGVVYTDFVQAIIVLGTALYVSVLGFLHVDEIMIASQRGSEWFSMVPHWTISMPQNYEMYNLFMLCVAVWFIKSILEGLGGPTSAGYMAQRYYSAKDEKDCIRMTALWSVLLSTRWPFIIALAALGLTIPGIADPEKVLPSVILYYFPVGLKGVIVAALVSASLSTFDSTVNSGSAYFVNDIYYTYLRKDASKKELVWVSYITCIVLVGIGLLLGFLSPSIDAIWGWLTMGLSAGLLMPIVLRWFWWRFNGWGFSIGTLVGILTAIFVKLAGLDTPVYSMFPICLLASTFGSVIATLVTSPTESSVLENFWKVTKPIGFWKPVRIKTDPEFQKEVKRENRLDIFGVLIAYPWYFCMLLTPVLFILHLWTYFTLCLGTVIVLAFVLYKFWYRKLYPAVEGGGK